MHAQFVIEVRQTKVEVFLRLTNVMVMLTTDYEVLYNVEVLCSVLNLVLGL